MDGKVDNNELLEELRYFNCHVNRNLCLLSSLDFNGGGFQGQETVPTNHQTRDQEPQANDPPLVTEMERIRDEFLKRERSVLERQALEKKMLQWHKHAGEIMAFYKNAKIPHTALKGKLSKSAKREKDVGTAQDSSVWAPWKTRSSSFLSDTKLEINKKSLVYTVANNIVNRPAFPKTRSFSLDLKFYPIQK